MAKRLGSRSVSRSVEGSAAGTVVGSVAEVDAMSLRDAEAYENVERIRSELGDDEGYVLLSRRQQDSGQLATLAKVNASIFDVDYLMKKYGGGAYNAKFYKAGVPIDEGGFLGSVSFNIDPSVKPEPEHRNAVTVAGGGEPTWLASAMDKMGEAIKLLAERQVAPQQLPPPPDPMAMIRAIGETMKSLTPPPPPPVAAGPDLEKQLSLIEKVVNVGTKIIDARGDEGGGPASSGDVYMQAVSKLADPIVELVKAKAQQEALSAGSRRRALPPPLPTGPVPAQLSPAPAPGGTVSWIAEIQKWMPLIVGRQRKGLSAEDTAYFVMDELSDTTVASLSEFLAQPDADEKLKQVLPVELQNNPVWLGEFLQAVRDYLGEGEPYVEEEEAAAAEEAKPIASTTVPAKVLDLEKEADRRLKKLRDKPEPEQSQKQ